MHQRVKEIIKQTPCVETAHGCLVHGSTGCGIEVVQPPYDRREQDVAIRTFTDMLWTVTRDGGDKRARGEKPPWWKDASHEAAIFSHLNRWKHGERVDPHSGAHPLVHLAFRALAIAYQEIKGPIDPETEW